MKKQRFLFTKNKLHPVPCLPEFYIGQEVVITNNTCGHMFNIREVVVLTMAEYTADNYWNLEAEYAKGRTWLFDNDDCKPYEGNK